VTTGVNAPERAVYHEWIDKFKGYLKPGDSVLDIGCFPRHDYHSTMREFKYKTVDPNYEHHPDIVGEVGLESFYYPYDGLMCHGVHSECQNPFDLTLGAIKCLKSGGIGLFGIVLLGYPTYEGEKWRFTEAGVNSLLSGLEVLEKVVIHRDKPSFWFGIVRK
jgi:hypothetical protein